jgi:hypothetical protein
MLQQDITLYFAKDVQYCVCIVFTLLVRIVAYDKKKSGTEHLYHNWPSRCETNNKIKKGESANSIGAINIYHLYWRRHAERQCKETGVLKSSGHVNPANRANQEIV